MISSRRRVESVAVSLFRRGRWFCLPLYLATAICMHGCSADSGPQEDGVTQDLRQIARAYEVAMMPSGKPPSNLDQIRSVLKDLHTDNLAEHPDDTLVSPRDGKPYVIILGAPFGHESSEDILAYEQQGAEGTRYALMMSREVEILTSEEFANASFAQGHKPSVQ